MCSVFLWPLMVLGRFPCGFTKMPYDLARYWDHSRDIISISHFISIAGMHCQILEYELDESTARRHLKSPRPLSGRSLHLTLVTKWSTSHMTLKIQISMAWPRSNPLSHLRPRVQIDMFVFCFVAIGPLLVEIWQISYLTLKIQGQGHGQGQVWWSHLRPKVQLMCWLFVSWQSDHFW